MHYFSTRFQIFLMKTILEVHLGETQTHLAQQKPLAVKVKKTTGGSSFVALLQKSGKETISSIFVATVRQRYLGIEDKQIVVVSLTVSFPINSIGRVRVLLFLPFEEHRLNICSCLDGYFTLRKFLPEFIHSGERPNLLPC